MKTKLHTYLNSFACKNLNDDQKLNVLANFDKLVNSGMFDEEGAYTRIFGHLQAKVEAMASYEEMEKPTLQTAQPRSELQKEIQRSLEAAAQKQVSKSPDSIRKAIVRYRANLNKIAGAELVSAYTGGRSLTILDDSELSKVKNRWKELEASKADNLSRWESYASEHGLREKQSFEAFASVTEGIQGLEFEIFEV